MYDFFEVPVLQDGTPVGSTGDDPVGIPYWQVWYASGLDLRNGGLVLGDAGRILAACLTGSDNTAVDSLLLDDLRGAAQSTDPKVAVLGLFIRERILRNQYHADILDPAVLPTKAVIDLPTLQLIGWVVMRAALFQSVVSEAAAPSLQARILSRVSRLLPKSPVNQASLANLKPLSSEGFKCSDIDWDVTKITTWLNEKVFLDYAPLIGKFLVSKSDFAGMISKALSTLTKAGTVGGKMVGKVTGSINVLSALAAIITAALQYTALEVTGSQSPPTLIRTKINGDVGDNGEVMLKLANNNKWVPNGDGFLACAAGFLSNLLGAAVNFPVDGQPIPHSKITVENGEGMTELVHFYSGDFGANYGMNLSEVPTETDSSGLAWIKVQGSTRLENWPDKDRLEPVMKQYTFSVTAQPEEQGVESWATLYWDTLSGIVSPLHLDLIKAAIDVSKKVGWPLGDLPPFKVQDWYDPCNDIASPVSKRLNGVAAPMAGGVCVDSWSGTSSLVGSGEFTGMAWTAQVTWVYDPLLTRDGYVVYHPEGTVTFSHNTPCISINPLSAQVTQADGELVINNNTSPREYTGSARTDWSATITNTCDGGSMLTTIGNSWFMSMLAGDEIPLVGTSIAGTWTAGELTNTWSFTRD